jgi:hypothetical protein
MLVIIDASPHAWFFNNEECSLRGAVDDATGEILALFFAPNECLQGYFQLMKTVIANNGVPLAVYTDRHTIFCSPKGALTAPSQQQLFYYRVKPGPQAPAGKILKIIIMESFFYFYPICQCLFPPYHNIKRKHLISFFTYHVHE